MEKGNKVNERVPCSQTPLQTVLCFKYKQYTHGNRNQLPMLMFVLDNQKTKREEKCTFITHHLTRRLKNENVE
jgi:hypothetical protein